MENHTIVTLKKGEGRTIKAGGAWIFDNEIDTIVGTFTNGDVVTVHDFDGYPMGKGFINQNSKIRIRMLTRHADQEINETFLYMRVKNAWEYRKQVMAGGNDSVPEADDVAEKVFPGIGTTGRPDLNCCRVIFGEADFLPGLVIDKYADVLVVECLALGMEQFKETIVSLLKRVLKEDGISIRGVYERSDANERKKEGLPKVKGFIGETFDTEVEITENGVHYLVDVVNGQKTGFFLDQKYNRLAMQRICKGKRVLDCFTHMGTFALNAGIAGASDVTGLDISEYAVQQANANAVRNHLEDTVHFRCANVLDELPKLAEAGAKRVLPLNVGGAFHSPLMEPARKELAEAINNTHFSEPICPIYQNVDAQPYTDPERIKNNLIAQLTSSVRWTQIMQNMIADGATSFLEIGPGKVLQGLIKKLNRDMDTSGIQ